MVSSNTVLNMWLTGVLEFGSSMLPVGWVLEAWSPAHDWSQGRAGEMFKLWSTVWDLWVTGVTSLTRSNDHSFLFHLLAVRSHHAVCYERYGKSRTSNGGGECQRPERRSLRPLGFEFVRGTLTPATMRAMVISAVHPGMCVTTLWNLRHCLF